MPMRAAVVIFAKDRLYDETFLKKKKVIKLFGSYAIIYDLRDRCYLIFLHYVLM